MFKKPKESYLEYIKKEKQKLLEIKEKEEQKLNEYIAITFITDFKKILSLISFQKNDIINLHNDIYSWKDIAIIRYGERTGSRLIKKIKEKLDQEKDPCVDNITFCNLNNLKEVEDFNNCRGCCGRANFEIYIDGIQFKFGYNYGH